MSRRKQLAKPTETALAPVSLVDRVGHVTLTWLTKKIGSTRVSYARDLKPFVAYMHETSIEKAFAKLLSMNPVDAVGHCGIYEGIIHGQLRTPDNPDGFAPATINRRLTALRSMIAALRAAMLTTIEPEIKGVESRAYRDTRGITEAEFHKIVANLESLAGDGTDGGPRTLQAARDLAIFRLLSMTALRRAEVVTLDMQHVDRPGRSLAILQKKRKERHWIKLGEIVWASVERWLAFRGDAPGPLFQSLHHGHVGERLELGSVNWIIRERGLEVGVKMRPHQLRHFAITNLLTQGVPIHEVANFARHSKVETTMIYDDNRGHNVAELQDRVGAEKDK